MFNKRTGTILGHYKASSMSGAIAEMMTDIGIPDDETEQFDLSAELCDRLESYFDQRNLQADCYLNIPRL